MNNSSLKAGEYDICITRGATYQESFVVQFKATQTPVLESGDTVYMQLRSEKGDFDDCNLLNTLTVANGKASLDIPNTLFTVTLNELETVVIDEDLKRGYYDIFIQHSASHSVYPNQVTKILTGKVDLPAAVTRLVLYNYFGDNFANVMQLNLTRGIDATDQIDITSGVSDGITVTNLFNAFGNLITDLGVDATAFDTGSIQLYLGDGSLLTKGSGNDVEWISATELQFNTNYLVGQSIFMVS